MIFDCTTRVWSSSEQLGREVAAKLRAYESDEGTAVDASQDAHERAMSCVDAAFVLGFTSRRLGASIPDEYVAACCRRVPGRIGVAGIDPLTDDALDRLDHAASLGLQAVTVSPACQGFHPAHSHAMLVYERAAERSMPIIVSNLQPMSQSMQLEFGRPALWDEVARAFPDLPIVIGQLGFPWIEETLVVLAKHDHVYSDISGVVSRPWQLYNALLSAKSLGVMDKLLFGSGFPFETPAKAIETLFSLNAFSQGNTLPSVPRAQINGIVERDALSALGLEPVEVVDAPPRSATSAPMQARRDEQPAGHDVAE